MRTAALVFLLGAIHPVLAQQAITSATLSGRVEDTSGAVIAGIRVKITNKDRGQTIIENTDSQGRYQFLHLPAGTYALQVEDSRFTKYQRELPLSTGQALDLQVTLRAAGVAQSVEVVDQPTAIEAVRTEVADSIGAQTIDSLPLNGRNYLDLALLAPGVSRTNTGAPQSFAETSAVPGTGISVSGQRNLNNNFVVDGVSANDDAADLAGTFFSQEVIREFQVITAGSDAEFGRSSSGVINIATRSGGNTFHGRFYGFFRNQRMDARNVLAAGRDPLTQAQYGVSLSGPIVHNRTFYFSNFEQTHRRAAGLITIAPANVSVINAVLSGTPGFKGPPIGTGEFPTGWDITNYFVRIDHQINAANQLMVRYSLYDIASPNSRGVGSLSAVSRGAGLTDLDQTLAASEVASLSSRSLNEVRFEFTHSRLAAPDNDVAGPAVSIAGVANFGTSTASPTGRYDDLYELSETFSFQRANHFIKAGGDYLQNRLRIVFPGSLVAAAYSFSTLAAFQLGRYTTFQQAFGVPDQFQSNPNIGLFAQDEWKATRNLVFNLGLRYDLEFLPAPIHPDTHNIAPRLGLAWSPVDRKTVVRASYGLFFDRIPLRATSNALQRDGSKYQVSLLAFGQGGAPVFPEQLTAFPPGQLINITTIDHNIKHSYSQQASLQIERELGNGTTLSLGYERVRTLHLILSRNLNVPTINTQQANAQGIPNLGRPDSMYGNIGYYESSGDSYYNGLLAALKIRLSRHSEARVSYNFSKTIDDAGNFFFSTPQNNFDLRDDRGLSDNDQRHRITIAGSFNSSWEHGPAWQRVVLRNWQLSPLFSYSSALPFNVLLNYDRNFDTSLNDRPAGVGRNTGRGFDFVSLDARFSRTFQAGERWRVQALIEGFNLLNRANFALPNNVIGSGVGAPLATFGRPTAAYDPRQLQVGLRLDF